MSKCVVCNDKELGTGSAKDAVCTSCVLVRKSKKASKTADQLLADVFTGSLKLRVSKRENSTMGSFKVKSNFARNKALLFGDVTVSFDKDGFGMVPADKRAVIEQEMRVKPGRLAFVELEIPKAEVIKVEEPKEESGVEFEVLCGEEPEGGVGFVEFDIVVGDEPAAKSKKVKKG